MQFSLIHLAGQLRHASTPHAADKTTMILLQAVGFFFFPTDLWCLINDFRNKRFHAHWPHLSLTGQCKIGGQNNRHKGMRFGRSPRSGELRTQKLKSRLLRTQTLNVLSLKPGAGLYIATHATLTASKFFLANFYPSNPFTCIFSKTSPEFFRC